MVAVNISPWGDLESWETFWQSKGGGKVVWAEDPERELVRSYQVISLGTNIIIDRRGNISYRDGGATTYNTLRAEVEEVL